MQQSPNSGCYLSDGIISLDPLVLVFYKVNKIIISFPSKSGYYVFNIHVYWYLEFKNFKREWLHDQLLNPLSIYVMYSLYVTFKNYQIISALIQI